MQGQMTAKQTAEYLGVHLDTIYRMVRRKEIPHYKIRTRIFFSQSTIDEWIKDQQQQNQSVSSF
ncbi:DNA-binding protein [Halalkalibacillus sediminis]|uniref:DNA-binding protein n=1 Tax=Halalkalibacillus sediminis TaxID=2018042 RepID=A0A2I0QYL4_9BACI|nr:helix-turn-helix domain-containing protein [Halalkalibacillus sediminis]PKR79210.1 DNA-binding protein [Halalkalibacillus sediminis]